MESKMRDKNKTKEQLVNELFRLRRQVAELKKLENERKQAEKKEKKEKKYCEHLQIMIKECTAKMDMVNKQLQQETKMRIRAESALQAGESKFTELISSLPVVVFEMNKKRYVTFANQKAYESFGSTKEDFAKGIYSLDFIIPEDRDRAKQNINRVLNGESIGGVEYTAQKKDGSAFPVVIHSSAIINKNKPVGLRGVIINITERKQAEESLLRSRDFYLTLFEEFPALIWRSGIDAKCNYFNKSWLNFTGRTMEQETAAGDGWTEGIHPEDLDRYLKKYLDAFIDRKPFEMEFRLRRNDGDYRWIINFGRPFSDLEGNFAGYIGSCYDITERKLAEDQIQHEITKSKLLAEVSHSLAATGPEFQAVLDAIARNIAESIGDTCIVGLLSDDGEWLHLDAFHHPNQELITTIHDLLAFKPQHVDKVLSGRVVQTGQPILIPNVSPEQACGLITPEYWPDKEHLRFYSLLIVPMKAPGQVIGTMILLRHSPGQPYSTDDQAFFQNLADRVGLAITNARLYSENQRQLETISALYNCAQKLVQSIDLQELAKDITRTCAEVFKACLALIYSAGEDGHVRLLAQFPEEIEFPRQITVRWDDSPLGQGPTGRAIRCGLPVVVNDISSDPNFIPWRNEALTEGFCCGAAFPLISWGKPFGGIMLYGDKPGFFTRERVEVLKIYAHQAAFALENARLFKEARLRFERLQALRSIDMAITGSLDLRITLNIVLDQVTTQLGIHAADILLLDPNMQTLKYAAGRGFRFKGIEHTRLHMSEGSASRAALERHIVHITNLPEAGKSFTRIHLIAGEDFIVYYAVPLIAKGQIKGVLEIFHRTPIDLDPEWLNFVEALALQAAIAIDNTSLFNDLHRANIELTLAYDATIEGWSRALDLRDKETEGHSQRVTEITLCLARAMGASEAELVHIRRGALLHDIGKMGIPDNILLKPGPLSEEEWEIMRLHPLYAYEMLSPIIYLRPALDIPYCHHEKWDGTGYPRGLKGDQIPLAARIFAVVDTWDALHSDRPYRPGWPEYKVREYIREQAGTHFDPKVVDAFIKMKRE